MKYLGDKEVMSVVSRDELESAIKTLLPLIDSISGSKFLLYLFHYSLRCIVVVFSWSLDDSIKRRKLGYARRSRGAFSSLLSFDQFLDATFKVLGNAPAESHSHLLLPIILHVVRTLSKETSRIRIVLDWLVLRLFWYSGNCTQMVCCIGPGFQDSVREPHPISVCSCVKSPDTRWSWTRRSSFVFLRLLRT